MTATALIAGPGIATTAGDPPLAQAFELALRSMRRMKVPNWNSFDIDEAIEHIGFSEKQVEWLRLLDETGLGEPLSITPLVTAGVCADCGEHIWVGSKSVPSKCQLTLGCTGAVVKARSTGKTTPR